VGRDEQVLVLKAPDTRFEPLVKVHRRLDRGKVSEQKKGTADLCIVLRTTFTFRQVPLHANELDTSESIVYERKVLITKFATVHEDRLRGR
jgi:hypothetical protein